VPVLLTSS